jgi:hypothetical protein
MTSYLSAARRAALGLVLLASTARAQRDAEAPTAGDCTAAAEVVAHAEDLRVVTRSYHTLLRCPTAGEVMAGLWTTPPADSARLALLGLRSSSVADRRILLAALEALQRRATPEGIRRVALDVVLAQHHPRFSINSRMWNDPEHVALARRGHFRQEAGTMPVTAADRAAVVTAFRAMAQAEAGTLWGRVFQRIATDLPR